MRSLLMLAPLESPPEQWSCPWVHLLWGPAAPLGSGVWGGMCVGEGGVFDLGLTFPLGDGGCGAEQGIHQPRAV